MPRYLVAGSVLAAAALATSLVACGNGHTTPGAEASSRSVKVSSPSAPVWPSASTAEYQDDHQICKLFTALTALATALGKTNLTPQQRGIITSLIDKYQNPLTVKLRHDATATLANPTGPAIVRLQADCGQLGIYKAVWPGSG